MGSPADQLPTDDLRGVSHVPTRQAPSPRGFFTKGPHKASRQISLPPRNKFSFITRTPKKLVKETSPGGPQPSPDNKSGKDKRRIVKKEDPSTLRKEASSPVRKEDSSPASETSDSLVKTLDKLRLQPTTSSSHHRKDHSLPQASHRTADAAEAVENNMARRRSRRPARGERLHSNPHSRTQRSTGVVVIDDDSEDGSIPKRPKANLSSTKFFQAAEPSNQSSNRRQSRTDRRSTNFLQPTQPPNQSSNQRRYRRDRLLERSRSPYSSDSGSDAILTPESSETSHEDLSSRLAQLVEEEKDLLLAQRLQDEEFGLHVQGFERPNEAQQDAVGNAPSRGTFSKAKGQRKRVHTSRKRDIAHRGTQTNPIRIDSEQNEARTRIPVRARVQDYTARYGEPMDIDGMDPFKPQHAIRTYSKKSRDSEKKAPKRSRDCVVCGDSVQIVDLPSLADCDHQPETCTGCYSGWIAAQLQESGWREVKCPGDGCKVQLSYQEIQAYASPKTFQQYDTFITRAAVGDDPNFRWCRACDSGQFHISGVEGNIFRCVDCGHKACTVHENTWHEGETCEEYEYRTSGRKEREQRAQEEASLKAIGKLTKKCPGPGCTWNIQKNHGCDHMTCKFTERRKRCLANLLRFQMPI
ncbi:IBR domain containing protein [Pyrenophora tritici-repentis]|nr:IBR domain-containing protein [Pyrenophora tritici-repentis]KAG9379145.1 IBR domain containing protein [Pyrenophora tritici-repentis]